MNFIFLQAEAAAAEAPMAGGSAWGQILWIVAIIAVFYFFMIRPQNKQRQKLAEERNNMKVGDSVVTASGVYGKIDGINTVTDAKGKTQVESFIIKLKPDYTTRIVVYKDCVNKDISSLGQ
ncbi:MAG: preprotein translocase subunit YajC [Bacteroidales bacterium]|nr:preprotein translocase subunit YajC [Bacteroidales bacterium]